MKLIILFILFLICSPSSFGQFVFNKTYQSNFANSNNFTRANSVMQTSDSNIIVVGMNFNQQKMSCIKVNNIGDTVWSYSADIGLNSGELLISSIESVDGNYILGGVSGDPILHKSHAILIKLNNITGDTIWVRKIGLPDRSERCYSVKETPDLGFIFSGLRENEAFVKFMFTNLDIAESGKTIMTAAAAAIDSLQDVADKGVKISVRAGEAVGQRTNIYTEYPIVKNHGGEKSMKINNSNSPLGKIQFDVYPVPTTSILTVNYIIPGNATNAKIEIFDLTGKLIQAKLILQKEEYSIQFDLSGVETGIYTCIYKIDGKQISAKKIAVVK